MKRILFIWLTGASVNILSMWIFIFIRDYFNGEMHIPVLWMLINFIPIGLLIGYYNYKNIAIESKKITYLLLLFLGLCLITVFSRTITSSTYDRFVQVIAYAPFFLLPVQGIILLLFFKAVNQRNQLDAFFKSKNRDEVIAHIQNGKTINALDLLLEESRETNVNVFKYLSLQKSTLIANKKDHLSKMIDDEEYRRTVAQISQSLLELLVKD